MKHLRTVLWVLVAGALIGFILLSLPKTVGDNSASPIAPVAGFTKGTHFTLTTHTGETFDSNTDLKEGDYALIFFGFTHCPVICPTELQKFAEVMDGLPKDVAAKVTPLFITIDPERDTPEAMQGYVPAFHPSMVGLTGETETVHKVLKDWKVYYAKVEDPQFADYTMDHSTYAYFVDHDMNMKAIFRMNTEANDIIERVSVIAAPNN